MLICALAMVFCATFAGVTFAWLAANRRVDSDNVEMKVEVSPNLVISTEDGNESSSAINNKDILQSESPFLVHLAANSSGTLKPCTYKEGTEVGLAYLADTSAILPSSGLTSSGEAIPDTSLDPVPSSGINEYYYEYVVYIASAGEAMTTATTGMDRVATLTAPEVPSSAVTNDTFQAASVAFWVGETATDSTYKGYLNFADKGTSGDHASVTLLSDGQIPLNTADRLKVTMRFYFDGALEKTSGLTYVRSAQLNTALLNGITVTFTATEHPASP